MRQTPDCMLATTICNQKQSLILCFIEGSFKIVPSHKKNKPTNKQTTWVDTNKKELVKLYISYMIDRYEEKRKTGLKTKKKKQN